MKRIIVRRPNRLVAKHYFVFDSPITLPNVHGGFDLMAADIGRQRLFVSAEGNHTVEVADLKARTRAQSMSLRG